MELSAIGFRQVVNDIQPEIMRHLQRVMRTELLAEPYPEGVGCPFCGYESVKAANNIRHASFDCTAMRHSLFVFILMEQEDTAIVWMNAIEGVFATLGWGHKHVFSQSFCSHCGYGPKRYDTIANHSAGCESRPAQVRLGRAHALRFLLLRGNSR